MPKAFTRFFYFMLVLITCLILFQGVILVSVLDSFFSRLVSRDLHSSLRQLQLIMENPDRQQEMRYRTDKEMELYLAEFYPIVQLVRVYDQEGNLLRDIGQELSKAPEHYRDKFTIPRGKIFIGDQDHWIEVELFPSVYKKKGKPAFWELIKRSRKILIFGLVMSLFMALLAAYIQSRRVTHDTTLLANSLIELSRGRRNIIFPKGHDRENNQISMAATNLQKQLTRKETLIRQRLEDLTHDLKSPIAGVLCQLEAVEIGAIELTKERFSQLYSELGYINNMIEEMSDFYRLEDSQSMIFSKEIFDAVEWLSFLKERFTSQAEQRQALIETGTECSFIAGDKVFLTRATGNLINNALEHGTGGLIEVLVEKREESNSTLIRVINQGQIPKEDLPYLFNRYWKKNKRTKGFGLGLAISNVIAQKHGGTLDVENLRDNRICFTLSIPDS